MKKGLALFLTLLLCFTVFSACSNSGGTSGGADQNGQPKDQSKQQDGSKETVELQWITHTPNSPEDEEYMRKMIQDFESQNPGIKIKWMPNKDPDLLTKQQLAAGGGPDIIMTDGPTTLKQFAASGYLVDLTKYAEQYGWKDRFFDWAYDSVIHDGKLMGVPGAFETLVVYYNQDMFEKNGWNIPGSYQELVDLCKKISGQNIIPIAFGSSDFKAANEWWLSEAFNATLGPEQFKKVLKGEVPWNDPAMADAVNKLKDLWQNGYINKKQSHAITITDAWNLFYSGKAAMKMEGTWALFDVLNQAPFKWDIFVLPAWNDGVQANLPLALGEATGINAKSKHPDEAAKFIDFFYSMNRAKEEVKRGTFFPVNGVDVKSISDLDPKISKAYELLTQAMAENRTGYAAWTYWPPNAETYLWDNLDSVFLGQLKVEDYLANADKEAQKDKADGKLFDFGD